jgi:molybdopterin synthase catalytic subunit
MALVRVQAEDFDPGAELLALQAAPGTCGGIGSFIGVVRSDPARPLLSLTLEHYPAMTLAALTDIGEQAQSRFALTAWTVIHRYGELHPGERIVFVGAAAAHRQAALEATGFLIDWLKTKAPFWKKERFFDGQEGWVAALEEDAAAAERWSEEGSASF